MDLPIYKCLISDDDNEKEEVSFIAIVDRPAIERSFLAFNSHELKFSFNEEERIISGPAILANVPIMRNDKTLGKFYTFFDAPTIKQIALRFFRKGYNHNLNVMHNPDAVVPDCYVFESWLIEPDKGKLPMGYNDIEPGSWFISVKVDNPALWDDIKAGKFKGFSVEGFFKMKKMEQPEITEEDITEEVIEQFKKLLQDIKL